MQQKYYFIIGIIAIIGIILISGCVKESLPTEEITVEGEFIKDLGHPFSGPAIMADGEYYRISGENAQEITAIEDNTKIKVTGSLSEQKMSIPEAGEFREITERVIDVKSFEILE